MTRFIITLIMSVVFGAVYGQDGVPAVKGRVVDAATGKAIEYAHVAVTDEKNNTVASDISRYAKCATDDSR